MYTESLIELGLAKNEARIYEALLENGEMTVGEIATYSQVHRRNVYDTLNRLVEKGLVFEILQHKENWYQAVEPKKLSEMIEEKKQTLNKIMPGLEKLYLDTPRSDEVYIYKGIEGWKNYMRDILRVGQDDYILGGVSSWTNPSLKPFLAQFEKEAERLGIKFHLIYQDIVRKEKREILDHLGSNYRFLPEKYSTPACFEVFGDHIVLLKNIGIGEFDDNFSLSVIVNQQIADSFRTWFQFMWDMLPVPAKE